MQSMTASIGAQAKILTRRFGPVGEIILNNPARHNAISLDMWERLAEVLAEAADDGGVRVLIVSGAGDKAFAADADIMPFAGGGLETIRSYNTLADRVSEALYNFPKPTIAKVNGACVGGGLNLAVCCDMRIASSEAVFSIPAAKLGLGYSFGGVKRLAEVVGLPVALELFFTARRVSPEEALRIGLVNRVVPGIDIDDVVAHTARIICENAPLTIAGIKAIARELGKPASARDLAKLEHFVEVCFSSHDFAEGRRAFMERRKPDFNGT